MKPTPKPGSKVGKTLSKVNQAPGKVIESTTDASKKVLTNVLKKFGGSAGEQAAKTTLKVMSKGARAVPVIGAVVSVVEAGMIQSDLNKLSTSEKLDYFREHEQRLDNYRDGKVFGADLGIAGQAIDKVSGGFMELIPTAVLIANTPDLLQDMGTDYAEDDIASGTKLQDMYNNAINSNELTAFKGAIESYTMDFDQSPDVEKLTASYSLLPDNVTVALDNLMRTEKAAWGAGQIIKKARTDFSNAFDRDNPMYYLDMWSIYEDHEEEAFKQATGRDRINDIMHPEYFYNVIPKTGDIFDTQRLLANIISTKTNNTPRKDKHNFVKNLQIMFDDFTIGKDVRKGRSGSTNSTKAGLIEYYAAADAADLQYDEKHNEMIQAASLAEETLSRYLRSQQQKLNNMGISPIDTTIKEDQQQLDDVYDYNRLAAKFSSNPNVDLLKPQTGRQSSELSFKSGMTSPDIDMLTGTTINAGSLTSNVSTDTESLEFMVDVQEGYDTQLIEQVNHAIKTLMDQTKTLEELTTAIELMNDQLPEEIQINTSNYIYTTTEKLPIDLGITQ